MSQVPAIRIVIAGGGTGGHVVPALAVVEELRRQNAAVELLWIGSHGGVERETAERELIPFRSVATGKFRRYLALKTIPDAFRIPFGSLQAWRILRQFRPDVIFSTGGFVSTPSVVAGTRMAPVLGHEQTASLGLATRINMRFVDVLALSFEQCRAHTNGVDCRVIVTGNPVRRSLDDGSRGRGLALFGFSGEMPVAYITGGLCGASPLNHRVEQLLPGLLEHCQILHQTGSGSDNPDFERLSALQASLPSRLRSNYQVRERLGKEIADVYAMADLVVGRAGAGTVAELAYLGKPSILIPLPGSGGGEQMRNAALLASTGAAISLPQLEATPQRLGDEILGLLASPERLREMAANALAAGKPDAAKRLSSEILALAESARSRRRR
jgi:UDP-N-acetylglucosamine--N-acetylmuramyl-(pentapeptide) pyrophosphoryl-undecaprenol N-acetylglucosamine transferase